MEKKEIYFNTKTYLYVETDSKSKTITLPTLGVEYDDVIVYVKRQFTGNDWIDKCECYNINPNDLLNQVENPPYIDLLEVLNHGDTIILQDFKNVVWDWEQLNLFLQNLDELDITLSVYETRSNDIKSIIKATKIGEQFSLPFDEEHIKKLFELYKYREKQNYLQCKWNSTQYRK